MAIYITPTGVRLKEDDSGNYHLFFLANDNKEHHLKLIPLWKPVLGGKSIETKCDELQNKLGQAKDIQTNTLGFFEIRIDFKDGDLCIVECKNIEDLPICSR